MTHRMSHGAAGDPDASREEARFRELMAIVRDTTPAPPGYRERVMARVRAEGRPAWRRALDWFMRPRELHLSPAGGLAMAAAASLALLALPGDPREAPGRDGAQGVQTAAAPAAVQVVTRFVFVAPQASSVHLTGDFLGWDEGGVALADPRGTGVWMVDLPLDPGVYQYAFVVDGQEWRPDPLAVSQVDDGFGRQNSVVIVTREI